MASRDQDRVIEMRQQSGRNTHRTIADPRHTVVRFPVQPPTHYTPDGTPVQIRDSEGWVDVTVTSDGTLEIRGAHALVIIPDVANTFTVGLR